VAKPRVEITYCTKCRFLLRAAWLAQELLTSFEAELGAVTLVPGSGGIFEVTLGGEVIATNREGAPMPGVRDVKRAVRDRVAPDRAIGHEGGRSD
jgi:selenoprotein W-related protein